MKNLAEMVQGKYHRNDWTLLRTLRCWGPAVLFSMWAIDTILRPMSIVPKYSLLNDML